MNPSLRPWTKRSSFLMYSFFIGKLGIPGIPNLSGTPRKHKRQYVEGAQAAGKRPWTPGRRGFQRQTQARSGIRGQFPTSHSPARVRPGPPGEGRHAAGRPNRAKRTDCPMETRSPKPSSLLNCSGFEGGRTGFQSTGRSVGTMRSLAEACWAAIHSDPLGLSTVRSGAEGVRFRQAQGP